MGLQKHEHGYKTIALTLQAHEVCQNSEPNCSSLWLSSPNPSLTKNGLLMEHDSRKAPEKRIDQVFMTGCQPFYLRQLQAREGPTVDIA